MNNKETITRLENSYYDAPSSGDEPVEEDELHDGDDWEYWANRMKEDLEKDGGAK